MNYSPNIVNFIKMAENTLITVLARVDILPGAEEEIKAAARELWTETRKESGCITFDYFLEIDKPVIIFYEIYRSAADFETHKNTPYTQSFFKALAGKAVGNAPQVMYLEKVQ